MQQPFYVPPQNLPGQFRCGNHPDREGIGICVSCRSVICVECSTKIDRMNYCIRCLQAAAQPAKEARREDPRRDALMGLPLLALSLLGTAAVFALLGLILAVIRSASHGGVTVG